MKSLLMCYEEYPRSGGKRARVTWWRWRDIFGWQRLTHSPSPDAIARARAAGELYEVPGCGDCSQLPASMDTMERVAAWMTF